MRDKPDSTGVLSYSIRLLLAVLLGTSVLLLCDFNARSLHAQVAPITPSGLNTQINLSATPPAGHVQYDITGGTRPGGGTNLFHSFGDFNVPNHNIANFLNDSGLATSNILGRVTGGNISNIFGTIQTTGFGNANLFLMNPTGFLFGPNATVNVGGMVAFTSADYLRLANGVLFNAIPNATADALLSAAPVAAFGFLGSNPGAITVQGSQLSVAPGQSISLVGANIAVQSGLLDDGSTVQPAGLSALGGQINLASVSSPGEILTGTLAQAPNINGQSFGALGAIQVSQQSVIDVSGNGGGTVLIRGGQFLVDNSTISANITGPGPVTNGVESIGGGIDIQVSQGAVIQNLAVLETNVTGNATAGVQYGGVHVKADRIEILGTITLEDPFAGTGDFSDFTGIRSNVSPSSTGGNGGAITLDANSVLINHFAQVQTDTEGVGNAGNILVRANQNIDIDFGQIFSGQSGMPLAQPATGDAGSIELTSAHGNISLTNGAIISSTTIESPGTAGTISLSAPSGNILLGDLATLFTIIQPPINANGVLAVRAEGSGGISINTTNLELSGADIGITNGSILPSGDLTVNLSGSLSIHGGSFGPSSIHALAQGPAPSAGLNVTAHDIFITDGSSLTTSTLTAGAAGTLTISAVNLQLTNGGQISSASRQGVDPSTGLPFGPPPTGPAGTVTIQGTSGPAQSVLIDGSDSGIFTNTVGTGAGGNILVNANSVTLQNGGTLSAKTSGAGDAGDIAILASSAGSTGLIRLNHANIVTNTTGNGNAGTIRLNTGRLEVENSQITSFAVPDPGFIGGNGGNIVVEVRDSIQLTTSNLLTSTAGNGDAGEIHLRANSLTAEASSISSSTSPSGGLSGGNAGTITADITQDMLLTNLSTLATQTTGIGKGGTILVNAGTLSVDNSSLSSASSSGGDAGNIQIDVARLTLNDGLIVSTTDSSAGRAGSITITATDSIGMTGTGLFPFNIGTTTTFGGDGGPIDIRTHTLTMDRAVISSSTFGDGNAGDVALNVRNLTLTNGAQISAGANFAGFSVGFGIGNGGTITVMADDSVMISGSGEVGGNLQSSGITSISAATSTGNAGKITITTPVLVVENGGIISTSTQTSGAAGDISVKASTVTLNSGGQITSSSVIGDSGEIPTGNAGNVTIQGIASTAQSVLVDGASSGIFTDTQGTRGGGNIIVNANSVTLQNGGTLSATTSGILDTATGGTITVDATNTVTMNSASITASSAGVANAGSINITSPNGFTMQSSTITTIAGQGAGGGNIQVTTSPAATVLLQDSLISASVADGHGGGGNISIDPQFVILQNSQILAQAAQGQGGAITITAGLFLPDANSIVNADSGSGVNGTVTIQSPNAPISGQIQPLGKTPLIATTLLNQHCAALAEGNFSSFTVAGRDSLPTEPGGWLTSPLALGSAGFSGGAVAEGGTPARVIGPTQETTVLSLRQVAPAGFLTQSFAVDRSAGCHS